MENRSENKMGIMPVKPLILSMALPMMLSMIVQALYNIVDSVFVARISEEALTAVTLAFPLQNLMIAVGSGTGVGMNALLSKALGQKHQRDADDAANTAALLAVINALAFLMIGLFFAGTFIRSQTDNAEIIAHGEVYLRIVTMMSVGMFCQFAFERMLQSTGRTFQSMISQMTGAILNIILDPIMIFGLFGMPKLGVAGAAWATVTGQCIAAVIAVFLNLRDNHDIHLSFTRIMTPRASIVIRIYKVGIPSILMMSIGSVMTYLMNLILIGFSTTAAAVFGVYFKLQSFFFMPVFGLNNALIPVMAYNYGARSESRIREALRFSVTLAFVNMCIGMLIFETCPALLLKLFNASPEMTAIGVPALRVIAVHFPFAAFAIVLGSVFQAFSRSVYSLVVSVSRQLVVLIPVAWALAQLGILNLVWLCFPIAELVSVLLSVFYFRIVMQDVKKEIEGGEERIDG